MTERFHILDEAVAILVMKGVYRQAKVYRRGDGLYASHGSGFVRIHRDGTSVPNLRCVGLETPGTFGYDTMGRAVVQ